jgi:hypothetical protein
MPAAAQPKPAAAATKKSSLFDGSFRQTTHSLAHVACLRRVLILCILVSLVCFRA